MEVSSALSILFSKFNINFRVLLYTFIVVMVILAIAVSIVAPTFLEVIRTDEALAITKDLKGTVVQFFDGNITLGSFVEKAFDIINDYITLLQNKNVIAMLIVTLVVAGLFSRIMISFSYPAITDVINNFMSSNMQYGFFSNMLKNYKVCLSYGFFHGIFSSIIDTCILFAVVGIIKLLLKPIKVFSIAIGLIFAVVILGVRLTISSGVLPEMIVGGESNYFKALKKSLPYIKKNFWKVYSAFCIAIFVAYTLIAVTLIPTIGVAFFVLSAMFLTYIHILQLVFFFESKSMRYYTDSFTIVNTAPIEDRIDLQDELLNKGDK